MQAVGIIGLLAFAAGVIMLLVNVIKRKGLRTWGIVAGIGFVFFIIGMSRSSPALGIIGMLACIAAIVLFIVALVKKSGWGLIRSGAIFTVGLILLIIGVATSGEPERVSPANVPSQPTPTKEVQLGKDRNNPVPFGMSLTYGDQQLTVLSSKQLQKIGFFTPGSGNIYLAVKLKVDFLAKAGEKRNYLSASVFRVVGSTGYIYDNEWVDTDTPLKTGEFYGGSSTSGDLVFEVAKGETNLLLIWNCGLGIDRYFEIR